MRIEKSNLEVKRFFDEYASGFTSIYTKRKFSLRKIIDNLFRESVYLRFTKTIENCMPIEGKTVLDIGCGPGLYSVELARIGASKVVGIDFAPKMIELAKKFAQDYKVYDNCEFIVADFLEYDFPEQYDYTIAMGYIEYYSEPGKVIQKIVDLTKDKAFISIPDSRGFLAWQRKIRYKFKCPLFLYSKEEIVKIIKSVTDLPFTIEKLPRDYYVIIYVYKRGEKL
ncbi:MAG: class I SAM-dependent methyltransferase [Candidatus Kapaibacteriota bacterium]